MTQRKKFDRLIDLHIDNKLLKELDLFANEKGWNRSFTIREAIKNFIKK